MNKQSLQDYFDKKNSDKEIRYINVDVGEEELEGTTLLIKDYVKLQTLNLLARNIKEIIIEDCPELRFINGEEIHSVDFHLKGLSDVRIRIVNRLSTNQNERYYNSPITLLYIVILLIGIISVVILFRKNKESN